MAVKDNQNFRYTRVLFDPKSKEPFRLSRSKIDLFLECPRCFYFDRRLGVGRPQGPPFTLNSAVDVLLKKEFDIHRAQSQPHPLMKAYGIDAVPFAHPLLDQWRNNFKGLEFLHKATNFLVFGAPDDIWKDTKGRLIVVDYKATSINGQIDMNSEWKQGFKRQVEIYQWLLRQNGFEVSDTAYFVYANGKKDREAFDGKLEFDVEIFSHQGNAGWVEGVIKKAHECLKNNSTPEPSENCGFCRYRGQTAKFEKK